MAKKCKRPKIEVGAKFHWWDRDLWHIINIFNDGDRELIVLKSWAKYKNRWVYRVEGKEEIEWFFSRNLYDELNDKEQ